MSLAYLRADVSRTIGLGHLSRAMAMGRAFARNGVRPVVFCRRLDADDRALMKLDKNRDIVREIASEGEFLAALEKRDAAYLTIDLLEGPRYAELARALKPLLPRYRTVCFDTFFEDELKWDVHVGPGFDGVPLDANSLSGLRYFVFPQELIELAPKKAPWKELKNVLITLGGVDPFQATPVIAREFCPAFPALRFTAVIGPGFSETERAELRSFTYPNLELVVEPQDLGELYLKSDLAITSAGQTKFETGLFGIPSFMLANNDQEESLGPTFADFGFSVFLGRADRLAQLPLKQEFSKLAADPSRLREMSRQAREQVDGEGGQRVFEHIQKKLS